jgi:hypothetical protein
MAVPYKDALIIAQVLGFVNPIQLEWLWQALQAFT